MASKKTTTTKGKTAAKKKPSAKQMELSENEKVRRHIKELKMQQDRENTLAYQLMPGVLVCAALFFAVCFIIPDKMGALSYIIKFLKGMFSTAMWLIPACLAVCGIMWKTDYVAFRVTKKLIVSFFILSFGASVIQLAKNIGTSAMEFNPINLYTDALVGKSGGLVGGLVGNFLEKFMGVGAWIVCICALVLLGLALFNVTPLDMLVYFKNKIKEAVYNANVERQARLEERIKEQENERRRRAAEENERSEKEENEDAVELRRRRAFLIDAGEDKAGEEEEGTELPPEEIAPQLTEQEDVPVYGMEGETAPNLAAFDEVKRSEEEKASDIAEGTELPESFRGGEDSELSEIFTEDASIAIAGASASASVMSGAAAEITAIQGEGDVIESEVGAVAVEPVPVVEEVYHFPPINFLKSDPNPSTFAVTDELKQTSIKLVETLKNFGVKTKILNICCGPTVTRYELQPEIGVRVKAIANLADDIALHLAASGVRIEAPIPGKEAVGIEIPNKTVSTVYLRNLIGSSEFESQKSKITVGLGMDVAGSPIFMNIEKMPHILIAGATGMGKSVCINSFIVSILYKARPDEVKLMLIDPKKVEFAVYNGLPHLLVPVVSDPKKAAGALAWAVNEMERRFQLIEEVGVRNIDGYNEITKEDPEKEFMPKIVIIIDELADLMMTARDEVETSICRLAQKARAAGMHLVIGTQRPSVDVITGLIKANVPSRIACTVASQVDSRTVIDVAGAEKLLGRGDMLYAPVGSMKPMRVQGAFVGESEIENIVEFLKNGKKYEYDTDIIESIEREAARCGEKKKGRGASSDDGFDDAEDRDSIMASDDAILPAIEIAVEAGSVSTSMLQRKLSLGYARAARIVDKLEKLGVVGPFEGSKPRKVLITREEYLEMRMNYEGGEE